MLRPRRRTPMPDDVIRCPRCNYDSNPTFWDEHGCPTCAVLQAAKDRERRELAKAVAKVLALQRPSASRREQRSHVRAVLAELKKSGAIAPSNGGDRRMGIEDAAVYLAISESSLYKLAERLALPHEKHGN